MRSSALAAKPGPAAAVSALLPPRDAAAREFEYTQADFEAIRALIYKRAGISLSPVKIDMVYSRLARRLRTRGMLRFAEYVAFLQGGGDEAEWEAFTNALTTNLTSFFREQHHFPILAEHLAARRGRPLSIWCCASSTGEEPYTIAMTAVEAMGSFDVPVTVLATDLDTNVLSKAQAGVYPLERVERLSPERIKRFFMRGTGAQEGYVKVRPELARMVSFRQVNLLSSPLPVKGPYDAIFCRNVMIYFDRPTQEELIRRLSRLLVPGGYLMVGHSESLSGIRHGLELAATAIYRNPL